ncbi:hypothetical protein HOA91_02445 [Candidatus Woesearchaeota archaeon]|nr:hypothetical protein [Candidatus Woesearchaeota archaeon]
MTNTIDDCIEGKAKFSKLSGKHPYCPKEFEYDCHCASGNNYVPDDEGINRPICRLKIELGKPTPDAGNGFLSRLYKKS